MQRQTTLKVCAHLLVLGVESLLGDVYVPSQLNAQVLIACMARHCMLGPLVLRPAFESCASARSTHVQSEECCENHRYRLYIGNNIISLFVHALRCVGKHFATALLTKGRASMCARLETLARKAVQHS